MKKSISLARATSWQQHHGSTAPVPLLRGAVIGSNWLGETDVGPKLS